VAKSIHRKCPARLHGSIADLQLIISAQFAGMGPDFGRNCSVVSILLLLEIEELPNKIAGMAGFWQ